MAKRGRKEKDNWKKKRRQEYLEKKEFRYYIFCGGQATEPKYFQGFKRYIEDNPIYRDMVLIEIEGCQAETMRVIGKAEEYVRENKITKGQIWCVYDKDSFPSSDVNGVVQRAEVLNQKREHLKICNHEDMENVITLDSPIPYNLQALITKLEALDIQMVSGKRGEKQGPYFGKLTRFIQRLRAKVEDKRINFMFSKDSSLLDYDYMNKLCEKLMKPSENSNGGVKIIDFSEVPSDILPLIASLVARVIFAVQQWSECHSPIAIFCDEAHLYIPSSSETSMDVQSVGSFERIAKEGRKYGVGLVVISQRPSEVNRTVLSQCNNFVAMRLTNADDQAVIKRLLPDSLGDYSEMLPILDIGEAIVVGDASILPSRIKVDVPKLKPRSATVNFWDEWNKDTINNDIMNAVEALRKQSKN